MQRRRHVGQRHVEQVMHRNDRSVPGIEAQQRRVHELAVGQRGRVIGRRGRIERTQLDFHRPPTTAPRQVETRVDGELAKPGIEAVRVPQTGQVPPSSDEGVLDRIAGELRIPEDEAGGRVQARERRVDEQREGVVIASLCPPDQVSLVHGPLIGGATSAVAFDRVWRHRRAEGSSVDVDVVDSFEWRSIEP